MKLNANVLFADLDSLREQSEAGARLGYTGKQVIHPGQIDVVQRAFLPSEEQVRWAREVVDGFQQSQLQGKVGQELANESSTN